MPLNIVILASGSGTNASRIIELSSSGRLDVRVLALISNRPDAMALTHAAKAGVPAIALDHRLFATREDFDRELLSILAPLGCDLVVLAGYMRLLTAHFLECWHDRVINIHPALLPSFPGAHGVADAIAWGARISGVTVHFVEEEMDSGPPIIQAAVPVLSDDDAQRLQNRIHDMEYRVYPQALQWFAEGRVRREGRHVRIEKSYKRQPAAPEPDCLVWPPLEEGF